MIEIYKNRYNQFLCTNALETSITGGAITFQIKESLDENATVLVELQNTAAGGGSTEIEDVDLSKGTIRLKINASDIETIENGYYWGEAKVIISTKPYVLFQVRIIVKPILVS